MNLFVCRSLSLSLILGMLTAFVAAEEKVPALKPLMAVPEKVVYQSDFTKPQPLDKKEWQPRQGTIWKIEDAVLRGRPSTADYQASKKDHKGLEPRIAAPMTPSQFIAKVSVRFKDGNETDVVPFVEFGHHKIRIKFSRDGLTLLANHEALKLAQTTEIKYKPGQWYHLLAELKGEEFVVQFAGGPTLYVKHSSLTGPVTSGADGLGLAGPKGGVAEIDNVTLWSIKKETNKDWDKIRDSLPKPNPDTGKVK